MEQHHTAANQQDELQTLKQRDPKAYAEFLEQLIRALTTFKKSLDA